MADIIKIVQDTEFHIDQSPFVSQQPVAAQSTSAAEIYSVNSPGTNALRQDGSIDNSVQSSRKISRITLDGAQTVFSSDDYPELANLHVDGGVLAEADRLRDVCILRGAGATFLSILHRTDALSTPGPTEFKTSGSNPVLLTLGDAGNAGTDLETWILDAEDVKNDTLVANEPQEINTRTVISCDLGDVILTRLVSGGS